MTTTQHTPGPWKKGRQHRDTGNIDIAAQGTDTLVAIITCEEWGYGGKVSRKEAAANARLFEVAPELLASLQDTTEALANVLLHHGEAMSEGDRDGRKKTVSAARTLFAKATGAAT
jgi:hypothetical protein